MQLTGPSMEALVGQIGRDLSHVTLQSEDYFIPLSSYYATLCSEQQEPEIKLVRNCVNFDRVY